MRTARRMNPMLATKVSSIADLSCRWDLLRMGARNQNHSAAREIIIKSIGFQKNCALISMSENRMATPVDMKIENMNVIYSPTVADHPHVFCAHAPIEAAINRIKITSDNRMYAP